ncbi:MAG: HEAT repeat domain-containing protein, partial [Candidatus Glassbacteria bacterium]
MQNYRNPVLGGVAVSWYVGLAFFVMIFAAAITGCGKKEDPQLVAERKMVTEGVEILRGGTPVQRDSVIRTLYNLKNPGLLQQYLQDTDPNVQIGVVSAIGFLKDKSAAPALNQLLLSVKDYLLCETIVFAIGELADTSSVPVLVSLLEDPAVERDLRLSIPITLAAFGRTEASGKVEQAFVKILDQQGEDIELCSYIAVGILEILRPGNYELFHG